LISEDFISKECACGEYFTTRSAYQEHRAMYPWHEYIRATKKDLVCKLCKKRFNDLDEFLHHWEREAWHSNQALILSYIRPRKKTSDAVDMRPTERELLKDRIRQDKTKWRLKLGRRAEKLVLKEINYGLKRFAMTTIVIVGVPDVGKSSVALALAELIKKKTLKRLWRLFQNPDMFPPKIKRVISEQGEFAFYRPKVNFNFSVDTTRRQFAKARLGYTIMQDEDPDLMGKRSTIIKNAIANLLNQMREAGVNLIFCDPEMVEYVKMPNLVIEVVAKVEEKRYCKCIIYDRKKVARGWANIRILDDDHPLMLKYAPEKTKNVTKKKIRGGFDSSHFDWEEFRELTMKATKHVHKLDERGDLDPKTCPLSQLKVAIMSADIPGDSLLQQAVLDTVIQVFRPKRRAVPQETNEPVTYIDDLKFTRLRTINEPEFIRKIADAWPYVLEKRKERGEQDPPKFIGPLHAEAWYFKFQGMMNSKDIPFQIQEFHPKKKLVSHGMINNKYDEGGYPAIFQHEVSGECAEFAIWKEFFDEYEWVGGNRLPDLVSGDNWIEVKLRNEARRDLMKYIVKDKSGRAIDPEDNWKLQHIMDGKPFTIVEVDYDVKRCTISFYDVSLKDSPEEEDVIELDIENTD
jgi:hypothetical protein